MLEEPDVSKQGTRGRKSLRAGEGGVSISGLPLFSNPVRTHSLPPRPRYCSCCFCVLHMDHMFCLPYGGTAIHVNDVWHLPCGHLIDLHCLQEYLRARAFVSLKPEPTCSSTFGTVRVGKTLWIFDPRNELPVPSKTGWRVVSDGDSLNSCYAQMDFVHLLSLALRFPGNYSSVSSSDCDFVAYPISTTYIGLPGPPLVS
ncbi:hypothetical protein BDP27DRAFT_17481 [Rhodocollybia butyracea]|uniref:Uncharacterized protein n=1 Tax=Rhodocollybia butyracea TaxID=206335 RepID=A0A9P5UGM2_9AGAR|nr:hypothetical protein BDP27DRAFT_17481 [Rhodocollybia butyracea]